MALVTINHLRELGYCLPALRQWCRDNGVDIREFVSGMDSARLRAIGDPYAVAAADLADQEDHDGQEKQKTDGRF